MHRLLAAGIDLMSMVRKDRRSGGMRILRAGLGRISHHGERPVRPIHRSDENSGPRSSTFEDSGRLARLPHLAGRTGQGNMETEKVAVGP